MHEGCNTSFTSGKQVVDKLRIMGFSDQRMPIPLTIICTECSSSFTLRTFEAVCTCGMVYGVTPCHSDSEKNVQLAGIAY